MLLDFSLCGEILSNALPSDSTLLGAPVACSSIRPLPTEEPTRMKTLLSCLILVSFAIATASCSIVPRKTVTLPLYFRSVQEFDDWAQVNVRIIVSPDTWTDDPQFTPPPEKASPPVPGTQ